jgi:hypothetical protein
MPLTPQGYRNIFDHWPTRMLAEQDLFEAVVDGAAIDLSGRTDEALSDSALLVIATTQNESLLRKYSVPPRQPVGQFAINPLYVSDSQAGDGALRLHFPSPEYEDEFGHCRQYLPSAVTLTLPQRIRISAGQMDRTLAALMKRRVLLELPEHYL